MCSRVCAATGPVSIYARRAVLAAGYQIDRFTLVRALRHTDCGELWFARDPKLEREVALKMLPPSEQAADRLRAEARAVGRLRHPNVVAVYELGTAGDQAFCVMELVEGVTL